MQPIVRRVTQNQSERDDATPSPGVQLIAIRNWLCTDRGIIGARWAGQWGEKFRLSTGPRRLMRSSDWVPFVARGDWLM